MMKKINRDELYFEISMTIIVVGLAFLMWKINGHKLIILNLFFLPVVLSGFFLGRYRAGILTAFAVIAASIVAALHLDDFGTFDSPMIVGLSVTLWAAVLGLTAILVGTLSDERAQSLSDLHEAHVGVVEVLARYLQSAHPGLKIRSQRIAELSQSVAHEMKLTLRECDDIRVAALLFDMENIEITARVIRKAVGDLETQPNSSEHLFYGSELAHSLGSVLSRAFPLLLGQVEGVPLGHETEAYQTPIGAKIIRTVRAFDRQTNEVNPMSGLWNATELDAVEELRRDVEADHSEAVLDALEAVVTRKMQTELVLAETN